MEAVEAAREEHNSPDATEAELLTEVCRAYLGSSIAGPLSGPWVTDDGTRLHYDRECPTDGEVRPARPDDLSLRDCSHCVPGRTPIQSLREAATDGGTD